MMGSTSTASGLRRSARNLRSVDEMIGGKVSVVDGRGSDEVLWPA